MHNIYLQISSVLHILLLMDSQLAPSDKCFCPSPDRARLPRKNKSGFSLVEVVLAMGVVAVAFITTIALMQEGLTTFHDAIAITTTSEIFQQVVNATEQTAFEELNNGGTANTIFYFDGAGAQLPNATGSLYEALVTPYQTTLPGANAANPDLDTIIVQVARNPGQVAISNWSHPPANVNVTTFSTYIGKAN